MLCATAAAYMSSPCHIELVLVEKDAGGIPAPVRAPAPKSLDCVYALQRQTGSVLTFGPGCSMLARDALEDEMDLALWTLGRVDSQNVARCSVLRHIAWKSSIWRQRELAMRGMAVPCAAASWCKQPVHPQEAKERKQSKAKRARALRSGAKSANAA